MKECYLCGKKLKDRPSNLCQLTSSRPYQSDKYMVDESKTFCQPCYNKIDVVIVALRNLGTGDD